MGPLPTEPCLGTAARGQQVTRCLLRGQLSRHGEPTAPNGRERQVLLTSRLAMEDAEARGSPFLSGCFPSVQVPSPCRHSAGLIPLRQVAPPSGCG